LFEQKVAKVEELRQALSPKPIVEQTHINPRVYFHIRKEVQRSSAQELAKKLVANIAVVVPGIQRVEVTPNQSEFRYFKAAEESEAKIIADFIHRNGVSVQAKYIPGYEESKRVRPRHYELWLSSNAFN
jgi:hypothetical protein